MHATISVDRETDARLDRLSSSIGRSKWTALRLSTLRRPASPQLVLLAPAWRADTPAREQTPILPTFDDAKVPESAEPHHVTRRGHLRTQPSPAGAGGP